MLAWEEERKVVGGKAEQQAGDKVKEVRFVVVVVTVSDKVDAVPAVR